MKKLLAVILALCLLLLVGCNNTDGALSDNQSDEVSIVEIITSEVVELTDENSSQEVVSSESQLTETPTVSTPESSNKVTQTTQNNVSKNQSTNENQSGTKYLNHNEIVTYVGNGIHSGTEYVGQNHTDYSDFTVELHLYNAESENIVWASENQNIATVDSSGKVSPCNPGMTYITATVNNESFKCKVIVKWIETFFLLQYTDTTIKDNYRWIWWSRFDGFINTTIKYKIVEYTYDFNGNFVEEREITNQFNLQPVVKGTFSVDNKSGTIKILTDYTNQFDETTDIRVKLTNYDTYFKNDINPWEVSVQWLLIKGFAYPKDAFQEMLSVKANIAPDYDGYTLNKENTADFMVVTKDYTCEFAYDDVMPIYGPDLTFCMCDPSEFTWISSNESIVKIVNVYGSSEWHYDSDDAGRGSNFRYGGSSEGGKWETFYNRAKIKAVNQGTAYITVKYRDYEIAKIKVTVE